MPDEGLRKYEIIAPLLMPGLEAAEKRRLRREILEREGISERTLRRHLAAYRQHGYSGLKTQSRSDAGQSTAIPENVLNRAVELKQELPQRSVRRIIKILEGEGTIQRGQIPRSTLSRHLIKRGFGRDDLKRQEIIGRAARRFERSGRNILWQSDLKYGPYLPIGQGGKKIRTYLMVMLDDATRLVTHGEFYDNQRLPILEDCFRKAVLKYGKPDSTYVDNGKIFISRWFRIACARLGIRHLKARSYSPESKGKIERFNRTVEEFLQEVRLDNPKTLEELNQKFRIWLDEGYHHQPHSSLNGKTPMQAYNGDPRKVRFATPEECREAFLWEETRKVDKTGCFKLQGIEYEAGLSYLGKKIDVRYDPFDLGQVEVWYKGERQKTVEPLKVGEYCGKSEKLPANAPATHSRLLKVYADQNQKRQQKKYGALTFRSQKGGDAHV